MHPLTQLVLDLKAAGFPQQLTYRDAVYFPDTGEYGSVAEATEGRDYVRVPNTTMLFSLLEDTDYMVICGWLDRTLPDGRKIRVRGYQVECDGVPMITDDSLGGAMGRLWLALKGMANVH